jgi:putative DNA methylase
MSEDHPVIAPKKLIEVALPLDAINAACGREKSIRHGHPSTLHLWWARRPLAAARAVIFSQMVNDPEDIWRLKNPGKEPNKQERGHWTKARKKLFEIIEDLVKWENTTKEEVLERGREEIRKSWRETCELNKSHPQATELFNPDNLPAFHDPFAGGGAIPLEAQRLGLKSYASDLNPVAVLINKAMIEIPPKFAGREPVNPEWQSKSPEEKAMKVWEGAQGLAEDVRYYGKVVREEAERRIGHLYPKIEVTPAMATERPDLKPLVGHQLTVIAWIWARTVRSPSPAFSHVDVPLSGSFLLSRMKGNQAYIEPVVVGDTYEFRVRASAPPDESAVRSGTKTARGVFRCLLSGAPIDVAHIKAEAHAGRMGARMIAIVAEGPSGRIYLSPDQASETLAKSANPDWKPEVAFFPQALGFRVGNYGMRTWSDLFTARQTTAIGVMCEIVRELQSQIARTGGVEGARGGCSDDYSVAVATYLALAVSGLAGRLSTLCVWDPGGATWGTKVNQTFGRQTVQMSWDYAEANALSSQSGSFHNSLDYTCKGVVAAGRIVGVVAQADAQRQEISVGKVVSTDPPYYDNIGYADLSDYFYVWLRYCLKDMYPALFSTVATPKEEELVATPARHGGRESAEQFFLHGMTAAVSNIGAGATPGAPVTIFYAFKQSETSSSEGTASTGWETFLAAVLQAGMSITGTWPMRTELSTRMRSNSSNALASSIVLVCRTRSPTAETTSRRQFVRELNAALPGALDAMTRQSEGEHSPVAPVDLSQAIIGPGMAVFSKYSAVLEADGTPMTVLTALHLINRFLAEDDFDADTQFCLHWFDQHAWGVGPFGEADTLARAKGTSVQGVKASGVLHAAGGDVRLLRWSEYPADWDAAKDPRLPIWESLHQLVRVFKTGGESAAGRVLASVASQTEPIRQLSYRLYTLCERAGRAEDARAYNELITSWAPIEAAAASSAKGAQKTLFD